MLVNRQLLRDNKGEVGVSCVRATYNRLLPEIIPIRKVAMGTNDAHSAWAQASFNLFKQLAICFGKLDPRVTPDPPMPDPPPPRQQAAYYFILHQGKLLFVIVFIIFLRRRCYFYRILFYSQIFQQTSPQSNSLNEKFITYYYYKKIYQHLTPSKQYLFHISSYHQT